MRRTRWLTILAALAMLTPTLLPLPASAEAPANGYFLDTWQRTDKPVADGAVSRTWIWGPEAFTEAIIEPYAEAPGGERVVQYYDKSRMEITNPDGDPNSAFFVTNGLLVVELITGRMQTGDNQFEERSPAAVNVAGDADDPDGPTYASFGDLLDTPTLPVDQPVTQRVDRAGDVSSDDSLASFDVRIATIDDVTNHSIAAPFWEFMTSSGPVIEDGLLVDAPLFENPFFATGRPITEPYWATVRVAGQQRDVLVQCFERRCLTYTPGNPPGFVTEAGNVGQHYFAWRYGDESPTPAPETTIPSSATWSLINPSGTTPASRSDHSLVANDDGSMAYLFGGRQGGTLYGDLWAYDVDANQWTQLAADGAGPSARFGHNAAFDPVGNRVVIFGGQAGPTFFSDVWTYDLDTASWSQLAGNNAGPLNRYGAGGAYDPVTNSILITHGFTDSGRFDDTWRYSLGTSSWTNLSPSSGARPEPRCLMRAFVDPTGGRLLLFGGQSNSAPYLDDLWAFDLATRTWSQIDGPGPSPRNFYAAVNGENDRYLLLHGGNAGGSADDGLWLLDYRTDSWTQLPSSGDAPALSSHDMTYLPGRDTLLVLGAGSLWQVTLD